MSVRIGVAFDGFIPTEKALELAKLAATADAKSLWFAEHLGFREAITSCAAFAVAAPGPTLVPTAVSPYLWHPTPTAMSLATLDELAPGRVAVALGVGNPLFLQESGRKPERPIKVMREFVTAVRALLNAEPVHMDGENIKLSGARIGFKSNAIPVYIAAMGPDMLRLTGKIADGVVLSAGLSVDSIRESIDKCRKGAASESREFGDFRRAGYIFISVSPDMNEARDAVRSKLAFVMRNEFLAQNIKNSGILVDQEAIIAAISKRDLVTATALVPDEAVEAFGIAGPLEACVRRLRDFVDAGLDEPVLNLVGTPERRAHAIEIIRKF